MIAPPLAPPNILPTHHYCKIIPVIQQHCNAGDTHATGAEPKAEPPRASPCKSNDFSGAKISSSVKNLITQE